MDEYWASTSLKKRSEVPSIHGDTPAAQQSYTGILDDAGIDCAVREIRRFERQGGIEAAAKRMKMSVEAKPRHVGPPMPADPLVTGNQMDPVPSKVMAQKMKATAASGGWKTGPDPMTALRPRAPPPTPVKTQSEVLLNKAPPGETRSESQRASSSMEEQLKELYIYARFAAQRF